MNLGWAEAGAQPRRRRQKTVAASALVELVPAAPSVARIAQSRYVLEVAGARVEFGDEVSVATLRRVLEIDVVDVSVLGRAAEA